MQNEERAEINEKWKLWQERMQKLIALKVEMQVAREECGIFYSRRDEQGNVIINEGIFAEIMEAMETQSSFLENEIYKITFEV